MLTGSQASQMYVQGALTRLGARLKLRPRGDRSVDIVMVYYQGAESAWMKISRASLGHIFADVPGAQLLFIDVLRLASQEAPPRNCAPQAGILILKFHADASHLCVNKSL